MESTTTPRRKGITMSLVLRVNAVVSLILGVLLLASTWEELYDALELPVPRPWVYAQLLGGALLGLAYLAWRAAGDGALTRVVAQGLAIVDLVGFVVIGIWLFSDDVGIPESGSLGSWLFDITAVVLVVLGVLQARAFWRRDA